MAYVYLHRKVTNNIIFYVGIGSDCNGKHTRAHDTYSRNRNKHWGNVVNKHNYYIEITHDNIIWEEACIIEKYLISFYGRKDLGKGQLVNKTDGGEGFLGVVFTDERRMKISEKAKARPGRKHSAETRFKIGNSQKGKIISIEHRRKLSEFMKGKVAYNKGVPMSEKNYKKLLDVSEKYKIPVAKYSLDGSFICAYESAIDASRKNNCGQGNITNAIKNKIMYAGYLWRYILGEIQYCLPKYSLKTKKVLQYSLNGVLLNEYNSNVDAAKRIGDISCNKTIGKACRGSNIYASHKFKNFIWKYKN